MKTVFYTLASIVLAPIAFIISIIIIGTIYNFAHAEYKRFHHSSSEDCQVSDRRECV
jgi:hypothetical protein